MTDGKTDGVAETKRARRLSGLAGLANDRNGSLAKSGDSIRALYVQTPASLAGNLIGMLLMTSIFWGLAAAPLFLPGWQ
jgi:hypothetical protein